MNNILMVFSKYSTVDNDPYLTNDLVNELCGQGHRVTVVAYGDANIHRNGAHSEERVIRVASSVKILKYVLLWPILFYHLVSILRRNRIYDQIVATAPLSVIWPAALLIRLFSSEKKTAMIFDIYPAHQSRIGALPVWSEQILKWLETFLLKGFTEVTAMGQNNQRYIQDYYFDGSRNVPIKVLYLWGRSEAAATPVSYKGGPIKVVFGGQIIKGRSVDRLIEFLGIVRRRGIDTTLTFYSSGKGYEDLRRKYVDHSWVFFQDRVGREEYTSLLPSYHLGAIVTDENVNLPAFPSKIVDYLGAGLYCFCLVEKQSELYNVVGDFRRVHINSFDFTEHGICAAGEFFHSIKNIDTSHEMSDLNCVFSVNTAVSRLLA